MEIPAGRRNCIPIVYTKGTHYDVGYDVVSDEGFFDVFFVFHELMKSITDVLDRCEVAKVNLLSNFFICNFFFKL